MLWCWCWYMGKVGSVGCWKRGRESRFSAFSFKFSKYFRYLCSTSRVRLGDVMYLNAARGGTHLQLVKSGTAPFEKQDISSDKHHSDIQFGGHSLIH